MARPVVNRVGEECVNNFGSKTIITEYRRIDDIDVYFPEYDWTLKHTRYQAFQNGQVKCPYEPRHYGVGYIGEGIYDAQNYKRCYNTWIHMLSRCYSDIYQEKRPSYIGCEVCDYWLNYQNFAEWYHINYYEIEDEIMNLDKDILYKGNRFYSPETCVFVPQCINSLFIKSTSARGDLPIGVKFDKRNGKYQARCNDGRRNRVGLGTYDTPEEAFYAYKEYKEKIIKEIADSYQNEIPTILYEAMYNYEVEIND
jgi:hypothetical protein